MGRIFFSGIFLIFLASQGAWGQRVRGGRPPGPKTSGLSRAGVTSSPGSMNTGPTPTRSYASEEAKVEFHSQTVLIQVPVIVADKRGNHIRGLSQNDFEVLENGKVKKITAFEEISASGHPLASSAKASDTFTNSAGANHSRAVTVIVLDTINTPFLDQAYGRKELIRYLASHLDTQQTFALVILSSNGVRILHEPTQDPAAVAQALQKISGELPALQGVDIDVQARAATSAPGELTTLAPSGIRRSDPFADLEDFVLRGDAALVRVQQDRAIEATMRGFLDIAWSLSGIPGRKSLVWATGSFPFEIGSSGEVPGGYSSVLYEHAMAALNDAQIAVYPVDVRGLVNTSPASDATVRLGRGPVGPATAQQAFARSWLQSSSIDTLKDFAEMTGGRAFYNTNDLANSFRRAAEDSSDYYILGYYMDTENRDPGWRKLKVKVARKDAEVRSRNGFFVTNATENPDVSRKLDLGFAATSPFDSTGLPISVQWTNIKSATDSFGEGKRAVQFLIRVAGSGIAVDAGQKNRVNLDVLALAFTSKDRDKTADFAQNLAVSIPDDQLSKLRDQGVGYRNAIQLSPGQYFVRFVVRDNVSGHLGSVSAPLTVN